MTPLSGSITMAKERAKRSDNGETAGHGCWQVTTEGQPRAVAGEANEAVHRLGQSQGNREPGAARHHRRHHHQSVAASPRKAATTAALLKKICQIVKGPTSAEVVATDAEGMIREGRELAAIDEHIVVKVPFTREGVKACKALSSEGMRVNVTLIFSPTQALLAAKVGATYVSPFVGRLDDIATSRHAPDRGDRRDLRELPVHDRDPRRLASAARSTSSKRRGWARTSARARRR